MSDIKPFSISVPEEKLTHLRKRLELTTFPDELSGSSWDLGAPLADIKRLHAHWLERYNWRSEEAKINSTLPQYTTPITTSSHGTLNIHFVHARSSVPNAIPLLFVHGWPGSFLEVAKILQPLLKGGPNKPAFHVVAPSVPGYGFSESARSKGFGTRQCAEVCNTLMRKLGYEQYVTQGGDWGSVITRTLGLHYPQHCLASHLNMITAAQPKVTEAPLVYARTMLPWSAAEKAGAKRAQWMQQEGFGYFKEHATKPQTIGYSQTDSPVGLLAWIFEKLADWTDDYPWTDSEVLTWISIYWFATAGPVGGTRLYYESMHDPAGPMGGSKLRNYIPDVKLGLARFPKELGLPPKAWHRMMGPVVFESEYEKGGHFAAWERPEAIVDDLQKMFGKGGGAYNVVKGKDGYAGTARL